MPIFTPEDRVDADLQDQSLEPTESIKAFAICFDCGKPMPGCELDAEITCDTCTALFDVHHTRDMFRDIERSKKALRDLTAYIESKRAELARGKR